MNPPHAPELPVMKLRRRLAYALTAFALLALGVRFAPYVAPIRAADLVQHQQAVEFTDRNGLPLGTLLTRDQEHTVAVSLSAVAPAFVHAIIASEDSRFARHGPVDYLAVARAAWQMVSSRHVVSGASTISMQLARMIRPSSSTIAGKLAQIWTAWRIAAGMDRDEILTAYVNRIPMGGNVYGVEAAARTYLGLPAAELDLAQASLLAGIPNDPTGLYPYEHWSALKARQRYVLERMRKDSYITADQQRRAAAEEIALRPRSQGIIAAPHFLFWLADSLPDGSAKVRTTIDRSLQEFVQAQVAQVVSSLSSRNVRHAAVLVVDNHTGQVLAYVGSPDYFSEAHMGRNDGVQALRQPGSALKPFLYELALENRLIHPNSILADVPAHYAIPGGLLYSPVDYNGTYQGPVRVRLALADSLNLPAVRVLAMVGVPQFLDRLHSLGFTHLTRSPDYYGLGLTLGGGEVSLWELTRAYVAIARGGQATELVTTLGGPQPQPVQNSRCWTFGRGTSGMGARHGYAERLARACQGVRHRLAFGSPIPGGREDGYVIGFSGYVDRRFHKRLHGRRLGRQLQRRPHALGLWCDRRCPHLEPRHARICTRSASHSRSRPRAACVLNRSAPPQACVRATDAQVSSMNTSIRRTWPSTSSHRVQVYRANTTSGWRARTAHKRRSTCASSTHTTVTRSRSTPIKAGSHRPSKRSNSVRWRRPANR